MSSRRLRRGSTAEGGRSSSDAKYNSKKSDRKLSYYTPPTPDRSVPHRPLSTRLTKPSTSRVVPRSGGSRKIMDVDFDSETDDSLSSDDFESSEDGTDIAAYPLRLIEREDVMLRDSKIRGAGKGVFCRRDISPGTILPYYVELNKLSECAAGRDERYFMSVTYSNEDDKEKKLSSIVGDGNPRLSSMKSLQREFRAAPFVNEASTHPPNCVYVRNPSIRKEDVISAYRQRKPLAITLLVVPYHVEKGEELFTMYGSEYGRDYPIWKDKNGYMDAINEIAHSIVDGGSKDIVRNLSL